MKWGVGIKEYNESYINYANNHIDLYNMVRHITSLRQVIELYRNLYIIKLNALNTGNDDLIIFCDGLVDSIYRSNLTDIQVVRLIMYCSGFNLEEIGNCFNIQPRNALKSISIACDKILMTLQSEVIID